MRPVRNMREFRMAQEIFDKAVKPMRGRKEK